MFRDQVRERRRSDPKRGCLGWRCLGRLWLRRRFHDDLLGNGLGFGRFGGDRRLLLPQLGRWRQLEG
jgi:hypothetical protein